MFIKFTYIWQALMLLAAAFAIVCAVWAFVAGERWWLFAIQAVMFALYFGLGSLWRSTERNLIQIRAEIAARQ